MRNPSDFQRHVFNFLAVLGLSQVQIHRERNGTFTLKTSSVLGRVAYFILRVNSVLKFGFLVLLSCGVFQAEFEFFEKMAIALWFLILILLTTSERLWFRKHPFFEILTAWWIVEERVYDRLGRPDKFVKDITRSGVRTSVFQAIIAVVGVLAVAVQYDAAPKYCVFAYSLLESEDPILKWIFGVHEVLILVHAWLTYGSVIYISSILGSEFTYNIEALGDVMTTFIVYPSWTTKKTADQQSAPPENKRNRFSGRLSPPPSLPPFVPETNQLGTPQVKNVAWWNAKFTPITLVKEYMNIRMTVTQLNNFAAYNLLYMHACSYIQMISDVFQLIQILRMPEASIGDVIFFAEDMMVCMYMLFRCFKSMAFLHPCSCLFQERYHDLLAGLPSPSSHQKLRQMTELDRKLLRKLKPTLRDTAFLIGPCKMKVGFVGQAIDVLLQYYICVALWK